ncbi:hypothetical protein HK099_007475, partial [Clydaea vesicula]
MVTKTRLKVEVDAKADGASSFVVVPTKLGAQTLTVLDNRTGTLYEVPISDGTIRATEFKALNLQVHLGNSEVFDPAYLNTAVCRSTICDIDGENGVLRYRGYPIEELAEKSSFMEVSYLLLYGELPTKSQFFHFNNEILRHTMLHIKIVELMKSFNFDSHPQGMLISTIAALSTFNADANPALQGQAIYQNPRIRNKQIFRLLGKVPTIAACAYRHRIGRAYNEPKFGLSYTENFLYMMDHMGEEDYRPNPKLVKALDVLFILHAEHELNCSTAAMRHIGSSLVDPYCAISGAASALYGPLHGGANEAVLRMLAEIKTKDNIPGFLIDVKNRKKKLMGFGHRIYKNYDPRAKIIRQIAYEVFEICGKEPLIDVAVELEKQALADDYFVSRKLLPNVDFYSGLIYKAMGFPVDMFPVLFTIPRVAGWLSHWVEMLQDKENKIWRPRQVYVGEGKRAYVPIDARKEGSNIKIQESTER